MAEQQISLLPFYKGWDTYQELLIKAIEPLSLDQLSLRAAPQLRSIGDLATHIIGVRAGWLYYTLEKGDENLVSLASQPARSAAELVNGLEATWQVIQDALNHWTIADLAEIADHGRTRRTLGTAKFEMALPLSADDGKHRT